MRRNKLTDLAGIAVDSFKRDSKFKKLSGEGLLLGLFISHRGFVIVG
jgi:hypothetical protein